MLTILTLASLAEAIPPKPSSEFSGGIWYVLIVVAVAAFIGFYVVKRISDIAVKRKTEALIRKVGEPDSSNEKKE